MCGSNFYERDVIFEPNLKSQTTTQLTLMIDTFSSSDNMMLNSKMGIEKQLALAEE